MTREEIENKYPQFNLSGYSTDKLIENEKYVDDFGGSMSYPYKPEYDAFSNDERYVGWENSDGDKITVDLGAFGSEEDIFDNNNPIKKNKKVTAPKASKKKTIK